MSKHSKKRVKKPLTHGQLKTAAGGTVIGELSRREAVSLAAVTAATVVGMKGHGHDNVVNAAIKGGAVGAQIWDARNNPHRKTKS